MINGDLVVKSRAAYSVQILVLIAFFLFVAAIVGGGSLDAKAPESTAIAPVPPVQKLTETELKRQEKERSKSIKQLNELVKKQRKRTGWLGDGSIPANVRAVKDITYGSKSASQKLDLFIPPSSVLKNKNGLPLVIWIHGGGWNSGDKAGGPITPLLESGFATASINYRLSTEAKWPAQLDDCRSALSYLRAHAGEYGIDEKRIGLWGGSAGGHLVLMMALKGEPPVNQGQVVSKAVSAHPLDVRAICDWFGPTDIGSFAREPKPNVYVVQMIQGLIGATGAAYADGCADASPITHVGHLKQLPPILIMHGRNDGLVPLRQSEMFVEKMKSSGMNNVKLVTVNGGHGYPGFELPAMMQVVAFFKEHLIN